MNIIYDEVRRVDNSSLKKFIRYQQHKKLINGKAGREHYKLLAYLTSKIQNGFIVELGTHHGTSCLAFSVNPTNTIRTYDVVDSFDLAVVPGNVTRVLGNIFDLNEQHYLLKANLIFLDTAHNGDFEWQVYSYLKENNYQGIIIYDDIHWSVEMVDFWNKVDLPKHDITDIGHGSGKGKLGNFSGTGIIDFTNQLVITRSPEKSFFQKIFGR